MPFSWPEEDKSLTLGVIVICPYWKLAPHATSDMEPVTIVSLIGACIGVTKGAIEAIHGLDRVRQIYGAAKGTMMAVEKKLKTLDLALSMLKAWADRAVSTTYDPVLLEQLSTHILGCSLMISVIRTKIETGDGLGHKSRGRFVWDESRIRELDGELGSQVQALHFLVSVSQLYV